MKKKIFFTTLLLVNLSCSYAQHCLPDKNFWADFKGMIGNAAIELSVYRSDDGKLYGNYRSLNDENKVFAVSGDEKDCMYNLNGINTAKQVTGKFTFQYSNVNKTDIYKGSFTGTDNKELVLQLQLKTMVGGTLTQRYLELFGTTNEVDSFAASVKLAVMHSDKGWLAAHCKYPLQVYDGSHKPIMIKSEKEFLDRYNKFFTQAYRDRFTKMHCYNMFCTHVGALMGKGEVVINHTENSTNENYAYCIGTITIIK